MNQYFYNKTVVISGGAGGLGKALIADLVDLGAKVAALDLNVEELESSAQLLPLPVDITDERQLSDAVARIIEKFGAIDVLINNAGITHMSKFTDLAPPALDKIMAVNFTASVNLTRLCLPHLIANQGQIVAVSSVAGFAPLYGRSAYSASKHAMEGFFRSLASELADDGVSVLVVCPSFIKTRPELTAKVNDGISSPGAMKKSTNGEQVKPYKAAQLILRAMKKRQRTLFIGRVARLAFALNTLIPRLYLRIMRKGAKQEFL